MHAGLLFARSWCQQPCRRRDLVRVWVGCRFGVNTFLMAGGGGDVRARVLSRLVGRCERKRRSGEAVPRQDPQQPPIPETQGYTSRIETGLL